MGGASIWHWIVVGVIVMLLFGRGKVSELMGDVAKGIKAFKKGMADEDQAPATTAQVPHTPVTPVTVAPPAAPVQPVPQPAHVPTAQMPPVTATEPVRPVPQHGEPLTNADRKVV
ncbi:twin-arginine translocase TatA/TatE family subunit [Methylobacterium terricola]|uniref:Sec-independent protein translocase protein TatA n=1 Tax=Methylobacterium terricola TaxID=2583531 RepID=A0A5C4LR52_9HYPH|nr:twin-arginine translocase TatA/TatE family subunit [Methylobacterium terricola]TNC16284.1 twin-arginine translocase TatA/TatE family subunit [Methylobacterium terricola]